MAKQNASTLCLLAKSNLSLRNGTNCSDSLEKELEHTDGNGKLNVIIKALECIYCIRNRCFHEGPDISELLDHMKKIRDFLMLIVASCVKNFVCRDEVQI